MIEPQDIYELAKEQNYKNTYDTLMDTKGFIEVIENDKSRKQFISDLKIHMDTEVVLEGICPECGEDLEYSSHSNGVVEHFGTPCSERITVAQCMSCSYVVGE